jgi:CubicO group peptidase (beta-lactamase class C family)
MKSEPPMNHLAWGALAALMILPLGALAGPAPPDARQRVDAALVQLDQLAADTLKRTGVPGMAVAVVYRDQAIALKGFGVRQAGRPESVDADTVFQLASVSKPIAATVMAALAGAGTISWDDRLIDRLPGFELFDPWVTREVRLRDMFCHRSGLPDHAGDLLEDLGYDRAEILRRLRYLKAGGSFRADYAYTNFGFTAAAVGAARAAGMAWEDLCAERLYRPLGMNATSSRFADYAAARNRAVGHVREGDRWVAKYVRDADAQSPAGGVSSSVRDMAQWLRLQLGGGKVNGRQVVAAAALEETHRPQVVSGFNPVTQRANFYGLGWGVNYDADGGLRLSHSGGFELGAATNVVLRPADHLGIVVLTNAAPRGIPEAIAASFMDLALAGKIERDWFAIFQKAFENLEKAEASSLPDFSKPPARPSPPLPASAYAGTYRNDYYGDVAVVEKEGALLLQEGPKKTPFRLRHWDRDLFLYQPTGEMAAGLSGVAFRIGPDARATSIVIDNLNKDGAGTFVRAPAAR